MMKPKAPKKTNRGGNPRLPVRRNKKKSVLDDVKKCEKLLAKHRYNVDKDWHNYKTKRRPMHPGWSAVPEYRHTIFFRICIIFLTASFGREMAEKRLDLKSLKGQTKAEELGPLWLELLSLRLTLKAF